MAALARASAPAARAAGRRAARRVAPRAASSRRGALSGAAAAAAAAATLAAQPPAASAKISPPVPQCELIETPSGIAYCDKVVGEGPAPQKGDIIRCHYTLRLMTGLPVDSSYNRGQPLQFTVGQGQVIKGWDMGILGAEDLPPMTEGTQRTLVIPPELAYGERGAGPIKPGSTLFFDVTLVPKGKMG